MIFLREEKRRFPRVNIRAPLYCQVRGTSSFNNTVTENISLAGVGIINDTFITPQSLVSLKIKILSRVLSATGRISWFSPLPHSDKFRMGIEFLELDILDRAYLSDYISMQTKRI